MVYNIRVVNKKVKNKSAPPTEVKNIKLPTYYLFFFHQFGIIVQYHGKNGFEL